MGSKSERDEARAALSHALAALTDGAGHGVWGPGAVGARLLAKNRAAARAFDQAAMASYQLMRAERPKTMIRHMQALAPVFLEQAMLDEDLALEEAKGSVDLGELAEPL